MLSCCPDLHLYGETTNTTTAGRDNVTTNKKLAAAIASGQNARASAIARQNLLRSPSIKNANLCAGMLIREGFSDMAEYNRLIARYPQADSLKGAKMEAAFRAGDMETGFALARYRWALQGMVRSDVTCHEWDGTETCDLIVIAEQGIGEQILYASMYDRLPPATIATDPRLILLMARSFPQHDFIPIKDIRKYETPLSRHAYTVDLAARYLKANTGSWLKHDQMRADRYRDAMGATFGNTVKVGLSWRSHNKGFGDAKTIPCADLMPLVSDTRITAIGCQYGIFPDDVKFWNNNGKHVLSLAGLDATNDLDGLASLISALDVVVTCSNTTAHLAGALGKRTVLMANGAFSLWYWGKADRSPWYPSVEILRGPPIKPWAELSRDALSLILATSQPDGDNSSQNLP